MSDHPVVELILNRARSGSCPRKRDDGFKLGLAIEGGAMRGVVSAGMVTALEYLGFLNVFDSVYGSSAGGFNGAFFLAKQAAFGTTIYCENINNRNFISFRRFFARKPIANLEYVFETVVGKEKILDWKAVLDSPIPLNIVVTSVEKLAAQVLRDFKTRDSLFSALHASSRIPFVAGPPVEIDGERFVDASVYQAIPIHAALQDNCTHVLVLLTRPRGQLKEPSIFERSIVAKRLDKLNKGLGLGYLDSNKIYNETTAFIRTRESNPTENPYICSVALPDNYPTIGNTEKSKKQLLNAGKEGMKAVFRTLVGKEIQALEVLAPFDEEGHNYRWL